MQHCHLGAARHVIKRHAPKLHVIAVVFNPLRFQSRYNLFRDFSQHVCRNNEAEMWVAELALGNRPFEVTDLKNDWQGALALSGNKIQLRDDLRAYFRQRNEDAI